MNFRDFLSFSLLLFLAIAHFLGSSTSFIFVPYLAIFIIGILFRHKQTSGRKKLLAEIRKNRSILINGGSAILEGKLINKNSILHTYQLNIGCLLSNLVIESDYQSGNPEEHQQPFFYSFISLISGWWSFPEGPLTTMAIIKNNAKGGEKTSVNDLIQSIDDFA